MFHKPICKINYFQFEPHLKYNVEVKLVPQVSYSQSVKVAPSVVNPVVESIEDRITLPHLRNYFVETGVKDVVVPLANVRICGGVTCKTSGREWVT